MNDIVEGILAIGVALFLIQVGKGIEQYIIHHYGVLLWIGRVDDITAEVFRSHLSERRQKIKDGEHNQKRK